MIAVLKALALLRQGATARDVWLAGTGMNLTEVSRVLEQARRAGYVTTLPGDPMKYAITPKGERLLRETP